MLDATRIGSNSIPRDSMQECATVQFWCLARGEDLLRWCHRTRRLILLIQNWNISSARPTRISFQVKSKLLRGIVEGSLEQKDACGRKPDYRTHEIFQWALDALAHFMLDHTGQMRNHQKLPWLAWSLFLASAASNNGPWTQGGQVKGTGIRIKNRWRIQRMWTAQHRAPKIQKTFDSCCHNLLSLPSSPRKKYRFWRALSLHLHMVLLLKIEEQSVKKRRGKQEERKRREKTGKEEERKKNRRKKEKERKKGHGKDGQEQEFERIGSIIGSICCLGLLFEPIGIAKGITDFASCMYATLYTESNFRYVTLLMYNYR